MRKSTTPRAAIAVASALAVIGLSATTSSAQVQYQLQKASSFDLSSLFAAGTGYGASPLSVTADDAGNAYVGGYNSSGAAATIGIVKVSGALTGAGTVAGLANTQFSAPAQRGLDALASYNGSVFALHDAGTNDASFIERLDGSGNTVWQTFNPGQLPVTSTNSRVTAMAIDPGYVAGGAPVAEVGFLAFSQGRRASLNIADGTIDYTFSGGAKPGAIINAAPAITNNSNYRALAFDSHGNVATGLENGFGAGVRIGDNRFSTLDGATNDAVSRVVSKSAGVFNVGNGISYLEGAASDELVAFSPRAITSGNGTTVTLTAGTGEVQNNIDTRYVQLRQTRGQFGYLTQTQLTGAEDGLGKAYAGEVKNFATGVDAAGHPVLYVVDYITKQLDVYTIEPRFTATANPAWSNASNWTLGIIPDSRATNATFVDAAAATTVTLDSARTVKQLKFGGANAFTIGGTSTLTLQAPANDSSPAYITVLSGNHSVSAPIALASNTRFDVPAGSTLTTGAVDGSGQGLTKRGTGTAAVGHVRLSALAVNEGTLKLNGNGSEAGVSRTGTLSLGTNPTTGTPTVGVLDIGTNGLIIDYDAATGTSQASFLQGAVANGTIVSAPVDANHVLAIVDYTDLPTAVLPTFSAGSGLTIDRSSTFIRYTFKGDTNLSGGVEFDDLLTLAKNYNVQTGANIGTGDTNGDGAVNFDDLLTLAKNYNKTVAVNGAALASINPTVAADWALAQSLVPEPTTLLGLGAAGLLLARRRRA